MDNYSKSDNLEEKSKSKSTYSWRHKKSMYRIKVLKGKFKARGSAGNMSRID